METCATSGSRIQQRPTVFAERLATITLGGIAISAAVWVVHAYAHGVLMHGEDFLSAMLRPDAADAWSRLVAIVTVIAATQVVQLLYAERLQAQVALNLERSRSRFMYDNSPNAVIHVDPSGVIQYANARAAQLAGRAAADLVGSRCHQALYGRDERCAPCEIARILADAKVQQHSIETADETGSLVRLSCTLYPVLDQVGEVESVVEILRDVTELAHTEEALRHSEERHRLLVDHSPDMILMTTGGEVSFVNKAGLSLLRAHENLDLATLDVCALFEPNGSGMTTTELAAALKEGTLCRPVPVKLRCLDGSAVDVELTGSRLHLDGRDLVQCVARDITERMEAERTIRHMAFYDALTGLPNRSLLQERLVSALARAQRLGEHVAVLFLDLDDFKIINDTLGHNVGDHLLVMASERLVECVREGDTVARLAGDEFTILAHLGRADDAISVAERVLERLSAPFDVYGHTLHVTVSVGIALFPDHASQPDELLRRADAAMYRAKEIGHVYCMFEPEMAQKAAERLELESELRSALLNDELRLAYQPQVNVLNGKFIGVEALVRWQHPVHGELAPHKFLPVAEQSGLINRIGTWVLKTACTDAKAWHDAGLGFGRLAVNLSAREVLQSDIVELVTQTLCDTGLDPSLLELEITENTALHGDDVTERLSALRALGVRIAIDDFGTGYASLSYLKHCPVHTLKIAQTFMRDVHTNPQSGGIARLMISLCRELGLDLVAEGVEHPQQLDFLSQHGCHVIQGFIVCGPVTVGEITRRLVSMAAAPDADAGRELPAYAST